MTVPGTSSRNGSGWPAAPDAPDILLPHRIRLRDQPETTLVRPSLTLTLYIAEPREWAERWASQLLRIYLERVDDRSLLRWYTTSAIEGWRRVRPEELPDVVDSVSSNNLLRRIRHLLLFQIADDPGAPGRGFTYWEVDPERASASGYVQMHFPVSTPPDDLLALAIEIAHEYPIRVGLGGYNFNWNPALPENSMNRVHGLLRRFLGFDVQVPRSMAWEVEEALPGVGWLTLIGNAARDTMGIDTGGLRARAWRNETISVMELSKATVIRAGSSPEVGDRNLLQYPSAHAEVAQVLGPWLAITVPHFPGVFAEEEDTHAWLQRFSFPEAW